MEGHPPKKLLDQNRAYPGLGEGTQSPQTRFRSRRAHQRRPNQTLQPFPQRALPVRNQRSQNLGVPHYSLPTAVGTSRAVSTKQSAPVFALRTPL
jgi:hypothetical protein